MTQTLHVWGAASTVRTNVQSFAVGVGALTLVEINADFGGVQGAEGVRGGLCEQVD